MQQMRATELKAYLDNPTVAAVLVDVREPWEFQKCHIAGSRLMPLGQLPATYQELDPQRPTVVICHHGMRSQQAGHYLMQMGFKQVINLVGGIDAWAREVDTTTPTY